MAQPGVHDSSFAIPSFHDAALRGGHAASAPARPHVLIVDDRPENLLAMEGVLESLDCVLIRAASGDEALREVLVRDYAVILLDVQMPRMDGYETATLIKQREVSSHIPIVFVTAINTEPSHVYKGYTSGAVDYILKPFNPDILRSKVAIFIDLWRKTEQVKQQAEQLRQNEKREAERLLTESAQQLDRFKPPLEATLDGLFMFEIGNWRLSYLNVGAMQRLGYQDSSVEEMETKTALDLLPEFDDAQLRALVAPLQNRTQKSLVLDTMLCDRDGECAPFEILVQFVQPPRSPGRFVATFRDISERKKAAAEIQKQMERMMALHHIDTTINASSDVRVTLKVILDEVTSLLNADAAVLLLNADTQMLHYVASFGFSTEA
ncbi:MAG TPA: response regulator, partial [Abditibacteriaceae bacterium]